MKVKVLKPFADKFTKKMYNAGQVLDFEADRAADLVKRELAEAVEEPKEEKPEGEPKKKATKKSTKK